MTRPTLSRRAFLRLALLTGIGAGAAYLEHLTQPVGTVTYVRWLLSGAYQQALGKPALVALGECPSYQADILGTLRQLWKLAEMPAVSGKRVFVKPNLIDTIPGRNTTTSPEVIGALLDLLIEMGAGDLAVGDGPGFHWDARSVARQVGILDAAATRGVPLVDLNYDDPQPVPVNNGWLRTEHTFWLPRHIIEADMVISVPRLKTHHWTGVSLSMKNLFGVVPGVRYGWPKNILHINGITPSILGLYRLLPQVVSVIDGIVGMEGDGPLFGTPVDHGVLAVGQDALAVDVTCARMIGFELEEIEHLALGAWAGVGQARNITVLGEPADRFARKYQRPPNW
jgi:uncharacterized protein (DUF362 family)